MPSRSNDKGKDSAVMRTPAGRYNTPQSSLMRMAKPAVAPLANGGARSYGDPTGYQAPSDAGRPVASPSNPAAVKAAMRTDAGATRPMPKPPVPRYVQGNMPLAKTGEAHVGIGGAMRRNVVMGNADKN